MVDNDVNWAARAERARRTDRQQLDDFAYLYLGEGLGCAVVSDGEVRRGHAGLAGEIAHLLTTGPDGRAVRFIDVFAELRLRRPNPPPSTCPPCCRPSTRMRTAGRPPRRPGGRIRGVLTALVALADPRFVVLGGTWGTHPAIVHAVSQHSMRWSREVPIRAASVATDPPLAGARVGALQDLQADFLSRQ